MNEAQTEITIPHLFRCPISLDLLEDPVTLTTGQTYDRSSIEKWISAGNFTCPVTMQKLHDLSFVPNHTLRHLINQWLQLGSQFHHPCNNNTISATIDYLATIKHTLESHDSSLETKFKALEKISVLSDEYCSFRKSCFQQLSFLALLLELVFGLSDSQLSENLEFVEVAFSCIVKLLPIVNLEPLNIIKDESKLKKLIFLFEKGTSSMKTSLCLVIDYSTTASQTEEVCEILGNSQKLVHEIVQVVVNKNCDNLSEAAIKALSALCSLESNKESLVKGGAIDGIIRYISRCDTTRQKNLAPLAMTTMMKLLVLESGKEALVNHVNGIETLVKMVFKVCNQECSESAVGILSIVCSDFGSAREVAIGAGVLSQLLFLLQSQCGTKTKTKARMLLKLLRSKWTEESMH